MVDVWRVVALVFLLQAPLVAAVATLGGAKVVHRALRSIQQSPIDDINQLLGGSHEQLDSWERKCTERRQNIGTLREGAASRVAAADARVGDLALATTQTQAYANELVAKFQLLKSQREEHLKACGRSEETRAKQHVMIRDSRKMLGKVEEVVQDIPGAASAHVATIKGAMEDAKARNADGGSQRAMVCRTRLAAIDEEARAIVSSQHIQATRLQAINNDSAIALVSQRNATADVDRLRALQDRREDECVNATRDIQSNIRDLKQRRVQMLHSGGLSTIVGDCEVTPWHAEGTCNVTCGGGRRGLIREVMRRPDGGMACPTELETTTTCNMQPCPVDCAVGSWGNWSNCSTLCDGGQRSRRRPVSTYPFAGGQPCPSTVDMEACGMQPCDDGCAYEDWMSWSACSKGCGGGVQTRVRKLNTTSSVGGLACPMHEDEEEACQEHACPVSGMFRCGAYQDLVFLIDGSELLREEDFADQLTFTSELVERFGVPSFAGEWFVGFPVHITQKGTQFKVTYGHMEGTGAIANVEWSWGQTTQITFQWENGPHAGVPFYEVVNPPFDTLIGWSRVSTSDEVPGPMVGIVKFGAAEPGGAVEVSALTSDTAALQGLLAQETRGRGGLDISPALAAAGRLLERGRPDAPSTVVVLVQGDPDSPHLTAQKSKRLQEQGVRVVVIGIGEIRDERNLKSMASEPWGQNYFHVETFAALRNDMEQRIIDLCPSHPSTILGGWAVVEH